LTLSSKLSIALIAAVWSALMPAAANATGTMSIHRSTGSAETYNDVEIKIFSGALFLTSDDGNGTIVVTKAACAVRQQVMVCLPTTAALVQDGESRALNLKTGTVYLNDTGTAQPLSWSSAKLPANSILLALTLRDGTLITVRGGIDELVRTE
jgi:hypothetical protein